MHAYIHKHKHIYIHTYIHTYIHKLMNIRIAKAFRTTSSEALCILTGTTPIIIKTEEVVKKYNIRKGKGSQTQLIDRELELKNWPHPADAVKIIEDKGYQDQTIQVYTDGSKNEHGVGSAVAIFVGKELAVQLKFKTTTKVQTTMQNN